MKTSRLLLLFALACGLVGIESNGGRPSRHAGADWMELEPPSSAAAVRFRQDGICAVPVLTPAAPFKGGATTGEEVTVRLDTAHKTYEIRIDTSIAPNRRGMRRQGTLVLDRSDCSYRLSGEPAARLAVSKDGILFGGLASDAPEQEAPELIVAFKNTSRDLSDLSGNWWVFESRAPRDQDAPRSGVAYEARILPDGQFSHCALKAGADSRCGAYLGQIHFDGKVFVSRDENGTRATLVVGRVGAKRVPILLQQEGADAGMRFLAPRKNKSEAAPLPQPRKLPLQPRH